MLCFREWNGKGKGEREREREREDGENKGVHSSSYEDWRTKESAESFEKNSFMANQSCFFQMIPA